jgi:hypothetical protein
VFSLKFINARDYGKKRIAASLGEPINEEYLVKKHFKPLLRDRAPGAGRRAKRAESEMKAISQFPLVSFFRPLRNQPGAMCGMLYTAGILLFITLSFCAYWVGTRRAEDVAKLSRSKPDIQNRAPLENQASLEEQLSDAAHEREIARAEIAQRELPEARPAQTGA